jgi:dihydrofolate reductase
VRIALVGAVARGGVIGRAGTIPWRLPEDLARFRELTMGQPVVMGRKTWESLPDRFRPLPGRRNVVVTRNSAWHAEGAERAESLEDALRLVDGAERVSVIGGGELYAAALPLADELLLTEIDTAVEGDTWFPSWDLADFEEASRERLATEAGVPFSFVRYVRRSTLRPVSGVRRA